MRILMLTASFAPRGTSAAVRMVNLTKYLERQGHSLRVVTYTEAALTLFSPPDPSLSEKVPPSVKVLRVPPGILRRWLLRQVSRKSKSGIQYKNRAKGNLLSSLLVPDPHIDAAPNFIKEGMRQILEFSPDVVVTHGYPFSMHLVGAYLKRRFPALRWVADYGDPWSGNPVSELPRPAWRQWVDYRLERVLLQYADRVTVTTEATRALYEKLFPFLSSRIQVIPMGFDPEDFSSVEPFERDAGEERVWLVHAGRLYSEARDPFPFIKAVSKMSLENPKLGDSLRIFLVGEVEEPIKKIIKSSPAKDIFVFVPWVPFHESIAWMKAADYLLLFGNKGGVQIPGKIYQYLGSGRPVLMISQGQGDPTEKIAQSIPGSMVVPNREPDIVSALKRLILQKGKRFPDSKVVSSSYSWPEIAKKFAVAVVGDVP